MPAAYTVTLPELAKGLAHLARDLPLPPLLKMLRLDLIGETRGNFYEQHGPDGQTWAPLKHARPNSKGGDKALLDRGILAAAVTSAFAQGNVNEETESSFTWGTNLEHAATHQFGATIKPVRAKFLAIPATMEAKQKGSPRNWSDGELKFRFGKRGGVATDLQG
jgi:phage gpG-like protein